MPPPGLGYGGPWLPEVYAASMVLRTLANNEPTGHFQGRFRASPKATFDGKRELKEQGGRSCLAAQNTRFGPLNTSQGDLHRGVSQRMPHRGL